MRSQLFSLTSLHILRPAVSAGENSQGSTAPPRFDSLRDIPGRIAPNAGRTARS